MVKVEWNRYSKSYLTFQFILYDLTLDNMGKSNKVIEVLRLKHGNEFISVWKFCGNEDN